MYNRPLRFISVILIPIIFLHACTEPTKPMEVSTKEPSENPLPSEIAFQSPLPPDTPEPTNTTFPTYTPTPEEGDPINPDKNILVMIEGNARISYDSGNSWSATGSGQWLETGDELQFDEESLALIFFFNGAILRLEGPSDFQLILSEMDPTSGATRIISRLWEGYALFETNPLPTPDSIFQLHVMTSFIDVEFDEEIADVGASIDLHPDLSIIAGGLLDEENEMLFHFRGDASMYVLDWDEEQYIAVAYPTHPETITSLEIAFLDDLFIEASLEGFCDIAGLIIHQYKETGQLEQANLLGYGIEEIEELESGEVIFYFESNVIAESNPDHMALTRTILPTGASKLNKYIQLDPTTLEAQTQATFLKRVKVRTSPAFLYAARNPQATNTEVKILYGNKPGYGCNPLSGYGCPAPSGCNQATGEKCTLSTGCNVVTKQGCKSTTVTCNKYGKYDAGGNLIGARLVCPASTQPGCNPNIAGDCDRFYDPNAWKRFEQDDEDDIDWCYCRAKVPPGWPPPPPWMDMYYRCWCTDPGAVPTKP